MLDFDSEDIDGMDDEAREEQEPPPTGRLTATSSYDIYMVDTPKEDNGDDKKDPVEDKTPGNQPKCQCRRRRSKPRHGKNSDTGTRGNNTPDDAEDNNETVDLAMEMDEQGDGKHSPGPLSNHSDAEDSNYQPVSKEESSRGDDAFIVPEEQLEQEHLHQRLISSARSLKKHKQRLKAAQDTLNDKWNAVLDTEEKYGGNRQTNSYPKHKLLPEFDEDAIMPIPPNNNTADQSG